jgi:two-component system OmpR family response regulator
LAATVRRTDETAMRGEPAVAISSASHLARDNPGMRILVVEDELKLASLLRRGLVEEGHAVDVARTGDEALALAPAVENDAIELDLMRTGIDGVEVCRRLRARDVWAPVLMLTARDAVDDRVAGLDAGADDYLPKPFSFAELLARLRALSRRGTPERPAVVEVGDLRLDPATRQVWRGADEIRLSAKEFALLETFMRRPGLVLSRLQLLEHAWDDAYESRSNVVDVYVRYLREKIDRPFGMRSLEWVRFRQPQDAEADWAFQESIDGRVHDLCRGAVVPSVKLEQCIYSVSYPDLRDCALSDWSVHNPAHRGRVLRQG